MNKTVILNLQNLKDNLTDKQIADNIRGLLHPALLVDIRVVDEPSVAEKPAWLKGNSDVEWSYNVIAEWLSRIIGLDGAQVIATTEQYGQLQKMMRMALTAARQAAAQETRERDARVTCSHCRRRIAVVLDPTRGYLHFVNDGLQPRGEAGRHVECSASAIRALAAREAGKGDKE